MKRRVKSMKKMKRPHKRYLSFLQAVRLYAGVALMV